MTSICTSKSCTNHCLLHLTCMNLSYTQNVLTRHSFPTVSPHLVSYFSAPYSQLCFFTFHLQAPTAQGGYGVGEQPSGPIKLTWRQGQPAPKSMGSYYGTAVVHGSTAYFSTFYDVYSYTVPENKWTELPQCEYGSFAMAVINDTLATIGGRDRQERATNTLLSLSGSSWEEVLPPMPTKRVDPAAANTPTHLVVAGGTLSVNVALQQLKY